MHIDGKSKRMMGLGITFLVAYAGLLFSEAGSKRFFDFHTTFLPFLTSFVAWLVLMALSNQASGTTTERVWRLFAVGMSFWVLAEGLWFYYGFWQGVELPYPSWGDLFWALGYLPIVFGLWRQYHTLEVSISAPRRAGLVFFLVVLLAIIGFGLHPLVNNLDLTTASQFFLDVVYLLLDITLLAALYLMVSALAGGLLSVAWHWVAAGFALLSLSDAFFSMLTWHGQYYPQGETNFFSLLTDYLYVSAYVVIVVGLLLYHHLMKQSRQLVPAALAKEETGPLQVQNRIVVFTDGHNRIISASPTLAALLGLESVSGVEGRPLREVLPGLERLERRLQHEGFVSEMLVTLKTGQGAPVPARVSGLGMREGDRWQGANILIGLLVSLGVDDAMNEEFRSMADYIASRAGILRQEHRSVVDDYLNQALSAFHTAVMLSKGPAVAEGFQRHVEVSLREAGYPVEERDAKMVFSDRLPQDEYLRGVRQAIEIAMQRAVELLGRGGAHAALRQVKQNMRGRAREILQQQGLLRD